MTRPKLQALVIPGTTTPIDFKSKAAAQEWLDFNEHPENDFDVLECTTQEELDEYIKRKNKDADRTNQD